jgi:type I restriction enzyme M protein
LRGNVESAEYKHLVLRAVLHHLAPDGRPANGSLTTMSGGEGAIRESLIRADVVDCIVALAAQLFYTTGIPIGLWFQGRNRRHVVALGSDGQRRAAGRPRRDSQALLGRW